MALINCPECGKSVSSKASTCIHCGYPIGKDDEIQVPQIAERILKSSYWTGKDYLNKGCICSLHFENGKVSGGNGRRGFSGVAEFSVIDKSIICYDSERNYYSFIIKGPKRLITDRGNISCSEFYLDEEY